ncbi:MAG: fasciclin domain-containing protein [Blastocatellia bacterium]|nr:fasciclin domain-containing protein [Blastocatellia bacterium]
MKLTVILSLSIVSMASLITGCGAPAANNGNSMMANTNRANSNMNSNMSSNMNSNMSNANTAGTNPMVGGAAMLNTKDIVDNASNSKDHTTLVAAVKAAGLVETLKGAGPFTVFAPTNAAFDKVPKATLDTLMKPESKKALTGILTYHVVAGKQDAAAIAAAIKAGNGKATFKTVAGGTLTASMEGSEVIVTDEKGGKSKVTTADVMQSNGVIHVVDTVLMPK